MSFTILLPGDFKIGTDNCPLLQSPYSLAKKMYYFHSVPSGALRRIKTSYKDHLSGYKIL